MCRQCGWWAGIPVVWHKAIIRGRMGGVGFGAHTIQARDRKKKVFPSERENLYLENNECITGTHAPAVGSEVRSGDPFWVAGEARRPEAAAGVVARFLLGGVVVRGLGGRSVYYEDG